MPWNETCVMDERMMFVNLYLRQSAPIADLCADFGISRKTAYKWVDRFKSEGKAGLVDRSRTPHSTLRH